MKSFRIFIAILTLLGGLNICNAQNPDPAKKLENPRAFMLFGASFAIPQNGWFEIACEDMGVEAINKAVSGEAIYHDARRMAADKDYTVEELDRTDVLVIMHVHNQNVANEANLKDDFTEYTQIATSTDYAVGYDYVIKKYIADCASLEFNEESEYYGVAGGKPARIMFCTHWHDGRTTYNPAIRKLAEKWGFPLVEFDTNIGFSKDDEGNADGGEPSRKMAHDTETIGGVTYGWHPKRGANSVIQRRMASIFTRAIADAYGYETPFEVGIRPVCPVYMRGEEANFIVSFRAGSFPYSLSGDHTAENLDGKRYLIKKTASDSPCAVSLMATDNGTDDVRQTASAEAVAWTASYCAEPDYDSYVTRLNTSANNDNADVIQLKISPDASRKAYISFQASELMPRDADKVILRLFYKDYTLGYFNTESGRPMEGIEFIGVEGNRNVYKGSNINWSTSQSHIFEAIDSEAEITTDMVGTWIGLDVTEWAKNTLEELEKQHGNKNTGHLTFRLYVKDNNWNALMNFYSTEGAAKAATTYADGGATPTGPQLLFASTVPDLPTGINSTGKDEAIRVANGMIFNPGETTMTIYSVSGHAVATCSDPCVSLETLAPGIYLVKTGAATLKIVK